jgi:predicted nucleic acid-binding protein
MIRVYLDNCCYNRPFDDQDNIIVRLEAEAKLHIQELIREKQLDLIWSSVNDYENNDNPSDEKRERIVVWKNLAVEYCRMNDSILQHAVDIGKKGIRAKDALHIASAVYARTDYFITTDKKILNKNISGIVLINPFDFLKEFQHEK